MPLYAAIDLHSTTHVLVIINEAGAKVFRQRIPNDVRNVKQHLLPYQDSLAGIVLESTYNGYWLIDALQTLGFRVLLVNPLAIQPYRGLKHRNDDTDAFFLADLLRLGIVKDSYIYPKEQRALRDLLRKRMQFLHQRTKIMLAMENLIARETGQSLCHAQILKLTEDDIKRHLFSPLTQRAFFSHKRAFEVFTEEIILMEKLLNDEIPKEDPCVMNLQTIPGVGRMLSVTIVLETGDITRFQHVGKYASYCRCCERSWESHQKPKGMPFKQNGNPYLAWAFVEAAQFARQHDKVINAYYHKKCAKTNIAVAVKTIANKLCRAAYYIQKQNEVFDVKRAFN